MNITKQIINQAVLALTLQKIINNNELTGKTLTNQCVDMFIDIEDALERQGITLGDLLDMPEVRDEYMRWVCSNYLERDPIDLPRDEYMRQVCSIYLKKDSIDLPGARIGHIRQRRIEYMRQRSCQGCIKARKRDAAKKAEYEE